MDSVMVWVWGLRAGQGVLLGPFLGGSGVGARGTTGGHQRGWEDRLLLGGGRCGHGFSVVHLEFEVPCSHVVTGRWGGLSCRIHLTLIPPCVDLGAEEEDDVERAQD